MTYQPFPFDDLDRVALAIDALCVGTYVPVLVHAEVDRPADHPTSSYGLFCDPLTELETLEQTVAVLARVSPPGHWDLAALCAPTVIAPTSNERELGRVGAWLIHVVAARGRAASRLGVPGAHELSGPTSGIGPDHVVDRCLRRLIQGP